MAGVLVPVVVDSVKVGVALNLRGTATGLVEVVALEGNLVTGAIKVHVPVVVAVAGRRVVGFTVDVVVGDRDTVVSLSTQDVVLTTNASSLDDESSQLWKLLGRSVGGTHGNVVEPDQVSFVDGDGITTPDVLRVDVCDSDVPMVSRLACIPMKLSRLGPTQELNVLDDDVLDTVDDAQTTALNNTSAALTNQGLVGANGDTKHTSVVA